jgi:hypothetical protein
MSTRSLFFHRLSKKHKIALALTIVYALLFILSYATAGHRAVPSKKVLLRAHFITTQDHTYDKRLLLHDYVSRKSYEVAHIDGRYNKWDWDDNGDVYTFMNPVVLGDHSVAYYTLAEKRREKGKIGQSGNVEGSINIANLKTGHTKQILRDHAGDLPASLCCSVDPSGTKLAIPQINGKLGIYDESGNKIKEITTNVRVVPQLGERDKKNDSDLEMLSGGYPEVRWANEHQIVMATGAPIKYNASQNDSMDTNSLLSVDLDTGQQMSLPATSGRSIPWFDVWDNKIVFASYDVGSQGYGDGPWPGNLRLYISRLSNSPAVQEINNIPLSYKVKAGEPGALVLDRTKGVLYVQDNIRTGVTNLYDKPAQIVTAINLNDASRKIYSGVEFDVKNIVGSEVLMSEDSLINKDVGYVDKGSIYILSTGKTEKIY